MGGGGLTTGSGAGGTAGVEDEVVSAAGGGGAGRLTSSGAALVGGFCFAGRAGAVALGVCKSRRGACFHCKRPSPHADKDRECIAHIGAQMQFTHANSPACMH